MSKFIELSNKTCYAVIVSTQRTEIDNGYDETAARMDEIVATMQGYLGKEGISDQEGFSISVIYFDSEENIRNWRNHPEHIEARRCGKAEWYSHFEVRVAKLERSYSFDARSLDPC